MFGGEHRGTDHVLCRLLPPAPISSPPAGGPGRALHVHEHSGCVHQLPVGPGSTAGLSGDEEVHRGPTPPGDREPETGDAAARGRGLCLYRAPMLVT